MSSHLQTIQFLTSAKVATEETAAMQAEVKNRFGRIIQTLAQAAGDTAIGDQLAPIQAKLEADCDNTATALWRLAEHIDSVIAQMQALG